MNRRKKRGRTALDENDLFSGGGSTRSRRERQKTAQLCVQVREALSLAFADIEDEAILELFVLEVMPAPDSSRLAVQVEAPPGTDLEAAHERLTRYLGRLRSEVASAIHRKKTPSLVFVVIPR